MSGPFDDYNFELGENYNDDDYCYEDRYLDDDGYEYYDDEYNDGQPSEYDEWQDVHGGDVEEYGTFGDYDHGDEW